MTSFSHLAKTDEYTLEHSAEPVRRTKKSLIRRTGNTLNSARIYLTTAYSNDPVRNVTFHCACESTENAESNQTNIHPLIS